MELNYTDKSLIRTLCFSNRVFILPFVFAAVCVNSYGLSLALKLRNVQLSNHYFKRILRSVTFLNSTES